jgi:ABC-2 type transport system ATP-binding protein
VSKVAPPPFLDVRELSRHFGPVRALDGLSFGVRSGEVIGLLGHNGAGKTTTIRVLNGLLAAHGGTVRVFGLDPARSGPEIRARTGVLTESPSIDERLSARENLAFAATLFGVEPPGVQRRVDELLDRFGLRGRADDRTAGFSRGMKQRLALARTLVNEPLALFLDEPTAALDPVAAREVHELIREFAGDEARSVVVTTHNLVEAQQLCDRVVILRSGRSIADGTPAEISRRLGAVGSLVLEVGAGQGSRAQAALRDVAGPSVEVAGDVLTIAGADRDRVPSIVSTLVGRAIDVYRVTPTEPSLEDAYFALHDGPTTR